MTTNVERTDLNLQRQEILFGSSKIEKTVAISFDPTAHSILNMDKNKAFANFMINNPTAETSQALEKFRNDYKNYRKEWVRRSNLSSADQIDESMQPLCVDIETAAICDLACSFCFRDMFFTPDTIIDLSFAKGLISQAAEMKVPSIKLNWRGEPLLYPKLVELISFAKEQGILEVMINTNATTLTESKSKQLIEAGLDVIIFSFDGGSENTYEKMRPGRFSKNSFQTVYSNIERFYKVREELGSPFPRSKIQMVLTNDTWDEQGKFFDLFSQIVDEVTVTQYNERGGKLSDLNASERSILIEYFDRNNLDKDTPYMKTADGKIFISRERAVCAQPFQRLLVTYDGRVGMCCHDWGAQHAVGYASEKAYSPDNKAVEKVKTRSVKDQKGFETFKNAIEPKDLNKIPNRVTPLKEVWNGESITHVRQKQLDLTADQIKICAKCSYKDAYNWEQIYEPE